MSLKAGTRLGPYRIAGLLGAGGMGEVYRATDTRLGRQVAIKALPDEVAHDTERRARFEREARVLASLHHPNVATLFGYEVEGDSAFLIMELVEGETLAERIARGAIPVEEAIALFVQIAQGLEAAHERGIIHRDLKPANIKVSQDGTVKILDFGLAKALGPVAGAQADASQSPTITFASYAATRQGQLLGTAAYMSPEQARGMEVDRRADMWAFGACLYEALTGRRAFPGSDAADTLAGVLRADVAWDQIPPTTPGAIGTLLRRCLAKDPRHRLRDIGDARIELEEVLREPAAGIDLDVGAANGGRRVSPRLLWGGVVLASAMGLAAGWLLTRVAATGDGASPAGAPEGRRVVRHTLAWPAGFRMNWILPFGALSPDGSTFVYNGGRQLYAWRLGEIDPVALPGTEGGFNPFFSPDGQSVAFFTVRELKRVPVRGGIAEAICEVSWGLTGVWGPDGTIVYGAVGPRELWEVPAGGGVPKPFSTLQPGDGDHDYAEFLPSGDAVLYTVAPPSGLWDQSKIVVQSRATGERKTLVEDAFYPRFASTGHLIFARAGGLFAARLDVDELALLGDPKPMLDGVMQAPRGGGVAHYAFSANGALLYVRGGLQPAPTTPVWVDRRGVETASPLAPARYGFNFALSPSGRDLVAEILDVENAGLWIFDVESGGSRRLTFSGSPANFPVWSADGSSVFYRSLTDVESAVYSRRADGSGAATRVAAAAPFLFSASPDGLMLLGSSSSDETASDLVAIDLAGGGAVRTILAHTAWEGFPSLSPDGRWLAYLSDETGTREVYVRPFPDLAGGQWQLSSVSSGRGTFPGQPQWRADGRELFYRDGGKVLSVAVDTSAGFRYGSPRVLFEGPYLGSHGEPLEYAAAPDGSRFLMFRQAQDASSEGRLILVENWFEELERLVPTG